MPTDLPLSDQGDLEAPPVTSWSRGNPLLASIQLGGLSIAQALRLAPGPGFDALVMSYDSPLMVSWDQSDLKVLIIAFDLLHSDLPLRAAFPVLLANALDWFQPGWLSVQADQVQAGSPRRIATGDAPVSVVLPDGRTETLQGPGPVDFLDTSQVGFYQVAGGPSAGGFAVNLASAEESDITPRFSPQEQAASSEAESARDASAGSPVWAVFAILALAAILAEWFLWLRSPQMKGEQS